MIAFEAEASITSLFADIAGFGVEDLDADLTLAKFVQLRDDRVERPLHVGFDDQVQSLRLARLHVGEQVFERDFLLGLRLVFAASTRSATITRASLSEFTTANKSPADGDIAQAHHSHRRGGSRFLHGLAFVIGHGAQFSVRDARHNNIARFKRPVLNEQGGHHALRILSTSASMTVPITLPLGWL
jgi:hypothetical protein